MATFSERSLYNDLHHDNYPIESSQLPMKHKRKKRESGGAARLDHNNIRGESIEKRPAEVNDSNETGHWEMNLVIGAKGAKGGKKVLLVLTERKTCYEYIILLKDKSQKSVIQFLNKIERKYGARCIQRDFRIHHMRQ